MVRGEMGCGVARGGCANDVRPADDEDGGWMAAIASLVSTTVLRHDISGSNLHIQLNMLQSDAKSRRGCDNKRWREGVEGLAWCCGSRESQWCRHSGQRDARGRSSAKRAWTLAQSGGAVLRAPEAGDENAI